MVRKITETEGYRAIIQKGVLREVIMRRRRNELTIGQRTFETRNAANRFFEDLLYNQPLKVIVQEPHHAFLSALISRHPRAEQIVGKGIDHFTVENSVRGRRCFCMTRVDGTKTDFSFFECVRGSE
jgi:hypothetical protein